MSEFEQHERDLSWQAWKAARATPQGAEPVAWQSRTFWDDGTSNEPGWGAWREGPKPDETTLTREKNLGIKRECRPVYTRPPEPKLSELQADAKDAARYRWLRKCAAGLVSSKDEDGREIVVTMGNESLDAAIDTELARQEGSAS